ncbi:hypothetical protein HKX48_002253 [Thoreauomyces humboldtii]|nr:hypothetical protein HKX48_002253 [Thoreauomyces humboldtii]
MDLDLHSDSDVSLFEALSGSEKFSKGSVTFDWSQLPTTLLSALPDPPSSAQKQLRNRRLNHPSSSSRRKDKENVDTAPFVSEKLAQWASRSLREDREREWERDRDRDRQQQGKENVDDPFLSRSIGVDASGLTVGGGGGSPEKLYTFNNCNFSYGVTDEDHDENHHGDDDDVRVQDESRTTTTTTNTATTATALERSDSIDIQQLLNIVQVLQHEEEQEEEEDDQDQDQDTESQSLSRSRSRSQSDTRSQSQSQLLSIHSSLQDLLQAIKQKNAALRAREEAVLMAEELLREKEVHLADEMERREREGWTMTRRNDSVTTLPVSAATTSPLVKENRRLQTSVRDLILSNKQCREQGNVMDDPFCSLLPGMLLPKIRKLQEDADGHVVDLTAVRGQLRVARERYTRLKASVGPRSAVPLRTNPYGILGVRNGVPSNRTVAKAASRQVGTQTPSLDTSDPNTEPRTRKAKQATQAAVAHLMRLAMTTTFSDPETEANEGLGLGDTLVALFPDGPMAPEVETVYLRFILHALGTVDIDVAHVRKDAWKTKQGVPVRE